MSNPPKKYHFVKVNTVGDPDSKWTWYFKPETKADVDEHWNKYVAGEIHNGVHEYMEHLKAHAADRYIGHYTTIWGSMIETLATATERPGIVAAMKEEIELYYNRMRNIAEGREIYLSEGLTMFMLTEGYTYIAEHYYSDTLSFPIDKYTIDDVRFIQ